MGDPDQWGCVASVLQPGAATCDRILRGGPWLGAGDEDALRVFYLLFRRESFVLRDGARTTFLQTALDEGRRYEERVASDLSGTVFERVFPSLVSSLAHASGEELSTVREAALIFLYRLLFILYAEDRVCFRSTTRATTTTDCVGESERTSRGGWKAALCSRQPCRATTTD